MNALRPEWQTSCREAITLLAEAGPLPTPQMIDLTDAAERKVIQARDSMIERLRSQPESPEAHLWRTALGQVNGALSELVSVEYPGALNRDHLELASAVLKALVSEARPRVKGKMEPLHEARGIAGTVEGGLADEEVHRIEASGDSLPETERLP